VVSITHPDSFEAEQYRRLRHQIELAGNERQLRVIAVTSPDVGDGKTLTAVNLAAALSRGENGRVLIIDADLRRPSVAKLLGLSLDGEGLVAALQAPGRPLADFVRPVVDTSLSAIFPAQPCAETYELLSSHRFAEIVAAARAHYDYVVVDTPPVIPVADSGLLRSVVDGYIVVVCAHVTPRTLLGEALNLLDPASVIGLVFNRDDRPLFGYYRSHYGAYFPS
jgi:capsular exopolysaccharide synthesis family protein